MTDDMILNNENWDIVAKKIKDAGLKPILLKYYINTNAVNKSKYKDIKKIFHNNSKKETINIINGKSDQSPKNNSNIKKNVKRIIKLIKFQKNRNHGMPLSEEMIDKIINKVLTENIRED
jgi:hypothetical protein